MIKKCIKKTQFIGKDIGSKLFFANALYIIEIIFPYIPRRLHKKYSESNYIYLGLKKLTN